MAANLREALRTVPMLSERYGRVLVMVDSPVLQVPADEFKEDLAETYYNHSFTSQQQQKVLYTVLPELKCVAVFTLHKDLFTVITDAWDNVRIVPALCSALPKTVSSSAIPSRSLPLKMPSTTSWHPGSNWDWFLNTMNCSW